MFRILSVKNCSCDHSGYDDVLCVEGEEEKNIIDFQETTLLINQAS